MIGHNRFSRRSGRIIPLFAFLMMLLALSTGISLNLSGLFVRHAHIQTCADAAAFSGAVEQARGLNDIARLNTFIVALLRLHQVDVFRKIYESRDAGMQAAQRAKRRFELMNRLVLYLQKWVGQEAAARSVETALTVTRQNEPRASLTVHSPGGGVALGSLEGRVGMNSWFPFLYKVETPFGPVILPDPGPRVSVRVTTKKNPAELIYFTNGVQQPRHVWAFSWMKLGQRPVSRLRAYATAMPHGGALWEDGKGRPEYVVKLVRTGDMNPRPVLPDAWGYDW